MISVRLAVDIGGTFTDLALEPGLFNALNYSST